ncbi:MAG: DUF4383 domain-containing protein [Gemmatimonadota bacterium]
MSTVQRVAQVFGIVFILVALIGFITSGSSMEADPEMAPKIFGLFAVNVVHNLVHLAFGIWGVTAARSWGAAKGYCQTAGGIYLVLAGLGLVFPTAFGLIPIGGHDIWLHLLLGLVLAYVGFTAKPEGAAARSAA